MAEVLLGSVAIVQLPSRLLSEAEVGWGPCETPRRDKEVVGDS